MSDFSESGRFVGVTRDSAQVTGGSPLSLLVLARNGHASLVALPENGTLTIGRDKACEVRIDDPDVSRRHVRLSTSGRHLTVTDTGSRNGTRVGGARLEPGETRAVFVGAVIALGESLLVVQRTSSGLRAGLPADTPALDRAAPPRPDGVVAEDPRTLKLLELARIFGVSMLPVLLLGETGVGKEVYAQLLHRASARAARPCLAINCAALPEAMLEAELFGFERGAFTGAVTTKPGLFESADGGTVFLDEVGELPPPIQAKLLRVLESGEVLRLGALRPRVVDVRLVSATNRDLEREIEGRSFRADLFFRLSGMTIHIPPLRERRGDILPLARHFITWAARRDGRAPTSLTPRAEEALLGYPWRGNARELRNVIARAAVLAGAGAIDVEHLGLDVGRTPAAAKSEAASQRDRSAPNAPADLRGTLSSVERERIVEALDRHQHHQGRAASALGISRRTLIRKLEAYGIPRPRKGHADQEE